VAGQHASTERSDRARGVEVRGRLDMRGVVPGGQAAATRWLAGSEGRALGRSGCLRQWRRGAVKGADARIVVSPPAPAVEASCMTRDEILPRSGPYSGYTTIAKEPPMTATPASRSARDRLREAQQAEARALKEVDAAARIRDRAAKRLHDADTAWARAQAGVVETSGLDRAAYLLDVDRAELRRRLREVEAGDQVDGQRMVSITESSTARQA
jgi:hypothetical protein